MSDDFERRIRSLPWRKPSAELKDKIFGASDGDEPNSASTASIVSRNALPPQGRRVTLHVAVALATAAAILGFIAGTQLPTNPPTGTVVASTGDLVRTDIRIVETSSQTNSFDFSSSSTQILPGEFVASMGDSQENSE
jgi:hypothetical protein